MYIGVTKHDLYSSLAYISVAMIYNQSKMTPQYITLLKYAIRKHQLRGQDLYETQKSCYHLPQGSRCLAVKVPRYNVL